jgi:predicted DNA-binding transcriptional regulator YafY
MNRTDRLYAIVEELRAAAPRYRSARDLAVRYEVSVRTVERDISALQQAGVPIYATPGRRGGYALDKATTLPPLNFSPREATAIAVALSREAATPFPNAARSALRKVLTAMPARDATAAVELADRVRLFERADPPPAPPAVIEEAMADHQVLQIEYRDRSGTVSRRAVEPVAFMANGPHWYLVAWCRLRQEARAFRTDRVLRALTTGERAPERDLRDVAPDLPGLVARSPSFDVDRA